MSGKQVYRRGHIQLRVSMSVIKAQYGCTVKIWPSYLNLCWTHNSREQIQFSAILFLLYNTFIFYQLFFSWHKVNRGSKDKRESEDDMLFFCFFFKVWFRENWKVFFFLFLSWSKKCWNVMNVCLSNLAVLPELLLQIWKPSMFFFRAFRSCQVWARTPNIKSGGEKKKEITGSCSVA